MATLGVVYDAEPAPRRPHDVIAVPGGRHGRRPSRAGPHANRKWLCGSVIADPHTVIEKVFDHAERCGPGSSTLTRNGVRPERGGTGRIAEFGEQRVQPRSGKTGHGPIVFVVSEVDLDLCGPPS